MPHLFIEARLASIALSIVILAGCTNAPRPSGYPYSTSYDMQSVAHWQLLANEVVLTQVLAGVSPVGTRQLGFVPRTVYVDDSDKSEFGKAFRRYLITELINVGIIPTTDWGADALIRWGTQLVFNDKDENNFPGLVVGAVELAGAAVVGTSLFRRPSDIEVIVITQIESNGEIASRKAHNFYISNRARWNFCGEECKANSDYFSE